MSQPLRIGFIGAGEISQLHYNAIRGGDFARLAGFWTIDAQQAAQREKDFACRAYASAEELVSDPQVDAVFVLTNLETHLKYTKMALEAGKHVLVEKPVAATVADIEEMKDLAADKIAEEVAENFDDVAENLEDDFSFDFDTGKDGSFDFDMGDDDSNGMDDSDTDEFSDNPEIPDGFPKDFCPIYQPAKLIGAQKYGDDATQVYVLMLVTRDGEEMIKDFYAETNADKTLLGLGMIIFQNDDGSMVGSVQLSEPDDEYAAKGNKTAIMISVTVTNE